jgi:hypothetical protein
MDSEGRGHMPDWTRWFRKSPVTRSSAGTIAAVGRLSTRTAGKYQPLYEYLENRYATLVVLRLSEIEDILGFALPAPARTDRAWWMIGDPNTAAGAYADAWKAASRTAVPNLLARTVAFERGAS